MTSIACGNGSSMVMTQYNKAHITSPNWPNTYPPNSDCKWVITQIDGKEIQLSLKGHKLLAKYVYIYLQYDINVKY